MLIDGACHAEGHAYWSAQKLHRSQLDVEEDKVDSQVVDNLDVEEQAHCRRIDTLIHNRDKVLADEIASASTEKLEPNSRVIIELEDYSVGLCQNVQ